LVKWPIDTGKRPIVGRIAKVARALYRKVPWVIIDTTFSRNVYNFNVPNNHYFTGDKPRVLQLISPSKPKKRNQDVRIRRQGLNINTYRILMYMLEGVSFWK